MKKLIASCRQVLSTPLPADEAVGLLCVWSLIGCLWFARTFWYIYFPAKGGFDIRGFLIGRDFVNVWVGGKLALHGKASSLYALSDYQKEMNAIIGSRYKLHNFAYPPHIILFLLPFGILPYFPSFTLWIVAGTVCFLLALKAQEFCKVNRATLALAALCPASLSNMVSGQNGAFVAALFLGGLYLCETSPVFGGVLFGLLTIKPHMGILIAPVLLLRRNWKCIFTSLGTSLALIAVSILLWGVAPWHDYTTKTVFYQARLLDSDLGFYLRMMPGAYADAMAALHWPKFLCIAYAALAALFAAAVSLLAVKKEGLSARSILMIALGTMTVLPYGYNYDMVAIAGALIVYLGATAGVSMGRHLIYGLLWALPLGVIEMKGMPYFPVSSAIMLAALACLHFKKKN